MADTKANKSEPQEEPKAQPTVEVPEQGAPEAEVPSASPERAPMIPKARLDQEIGKRRALEDKLGTLEQEIERLKKSADPQPQKGAPDKAPEAGDLSVLQQKLENLETQTRRRDLSSKMRLNEEQAAAVDDLMVKMPDLKPTEALQLARQRNEALFGAPSQRGYQPSQHASLRPAGGGTPQVETLKDRVQQASGLPKDQRTDALAGFTGELMAKALGWPRTQG